MVRNSVALGVIPAVELPIPSPGAGSGPVCLGAQHRAISVLNHFSLNHLAYPHFSSLTSFLSHAKARHRSETGKETWAHEQNMEKGTQPPTTGWVGMSKASRLC